MESTDEDKCRRKIQVLSHLLQRCTELNMEETASSSNQTRPKNQGSIFARLLENVRSGNSELLEHLSDCDRILEDCLGNGKVEKVTEGEPDLIKDRRSYLKCLGSLLELFEKYLAEHVAKSGYILSVDEERIFLRAVQMFIAVGICPVLAPGLGIPLSSRISESSVPILSSFELISTANYTEDEKINQLKSCAKCLLKFCESKSLKPLIISRFLTDLLASLLQLSQNDPENKEWDKKLDLIAKETFKPLLISSLLGLQSGFGSRSKPTPDIQIKIGKLLSLGLLEPGGLNALIRALPCENWKSSEAIAGIVCRCPSQLKKEPETYFSNICIQITNIIVETEYERFIRPITAILSRLSVAKPKLVEKIILEPLLEALYILTNLKDQGKLPEYRNFKCALDFVQRIISNPSVLKSHHEMLTNLFLEISSQVSELSKDTGYPLEESILILISDNLPDEDRLANRLLSLIAVNSPLSVRKTVRFLAETGGISVSQIESIEDSERCTRRKLAILVNVAKRMTAKQPDFIIELLQECIKSANDRIYALKDKPTEREHFLEMDKNAESLSSYLLIIEFLEQVIENCEDEILAQPLQLLKISEVLLSNSLEKKSLPLSDQLVSLVFGLISTIVISATSENKDEWNDIVSKIFNDLNWFLKGEKPEVKSSAEILQSLLAEMFDVEKSTRARKFCRPEKGSPFENALRDIKDPSPAVKGHGLIQLERLINSRNVAVLECNGVELFDVLKVQLEDEDSYVFLAAIKAMAALSAEWPNDGVPILLKEFVNDSHEPGYRVKIGEVLSKLCVRLNELAPRYSDTMIPVFLCLARNKDEAVRESSLSSLAQLSSCLSFKLTQHLHEFLHCACNSLKFDDCSAVRRAAIHLLRSILKGSSSSMIEILDDIVGDLYKFLKDVHQNDKDDIVRLHAELCLEEIGISMNEIIMVDPQKLVKHLKIK